MSEWQPCKCQFSWVASFESRALQPSPVRAEDRQRICKAEARPRPCLRVLGCHAQFEFKNRQLLLHEAKITTSKKSDVHCTT